MKRVAKEWEIWDKEEEAARLEEEAKKLVPEKLHKWIKVFGKKASERMLTRKIWDYAIDLKEEFVLRKEKVYLLSRKEREEVREFINVMATTRHKVHVKIVDDGLNFYFHFLFYFSFLLFFYF